MQTRTPLRPLAEVAEQYRAHNDAVAKAHGIPSRHDLTAARGHLVSALAIVDHLLASAVSR